MPKPILFIDFNGVISYKPFWFSLKDPKHKLYEVGNELEEYLFSKDRSIISDWMVGRYTSEQVHSLIRDAINIPYDEEELFEVFVTDCRTIDISEKILDTLDALKDRYIIVLMTDNMDCFDRFTLPANPRLNKTFDSISNSYTAKSSKRDNDCVLFKKYIQKYGAHELDNVFLDDSERNCLAFKESIGSKVFQVKSEGEVLRILSTL